MNNPQKRTWKQTTTTTTNGARNNSDDFNVVKKPRRSVKAEGACLNGLLKEGSAKVINANCLGKRLSSAIWKSFGAIQVNDHFSNPSIETKVIEDGTLNKRICKFFVACSRCFSVFKYDGHAYGTTGLKKHVKNCLGVNNAQKIESQNEHTGPNDAHTLSVPNLELLTVATTTQTLTNGLGRRKKDITTTATTATTNTNQPSLKHLAKLIEDLRSEQAELKQRVYEMITMIGSGYVGPIQILTNDGEKVNDGNVGK